jgi:hypothetical protein
VLAVDKVWSLVYARVALLALENEADVDALDSPLACEDLLEGGQVTVLEQDVGDVRSPLLGNRCAQVLDQTSEDVVVWLAVGEDVHEEPQASEWTTDTKEVTVITSVVPRHSLLGGLRLQLLRRAQGGLLDVGGRLINQELGRLRSGDVGDRLSN